MNLNKMLNLTGMVALVTGGGNGIGCGSFVDVFRGDKQFRLDFELTW